MNANKIRALIVDDELHARENLIGLLEEYCPEIDIIGQASGISSAKAKIEDLNPELLFLDIKLANNTGFQLLELLRKIDFGVIFVTAYDNYAIKAIRFSAVDYLLKPLNNKELIQAVNKFKKRTRLEKKVDDLELLIENLSRDRAFNRLAINLNGKTEIMVVKDIARLQGESNYTRIFFKNGESILVSKTLVEFEELLSDMGFVRVHKTHIVNGSYIKTIIKKAEWRIELLNEESIPVSRRRKNNLIEILMFRTGTPQSS